METNLLMYKNNKKITAVAAIIYTIFILLIINDIYPLIIGAISGLLLPGLILAKFLSETIALVVSSVFLILLVRLISKKGKTPLLIFAATYCVLNIGLAILYASSFN
ncbi:hypothetical protein KC851_00455 [Candidatus Kaiserbacteria bacterium]|nr:hypothetical protein [Candidatus Kaiserbacteria bacterium]